MMIMKKFGMGLSVCFFCGLAYAQSMGANTVTTFTLAGDAKNIEIHSLVRASIVDKEDRVPTSEICWSDSRVDCGWETKITYKRGVRIELRYTSKVDGEMEYPDGNPDGQLQKSDRGVAIAELNLKSIPEAVLKAFEMDKRLRKARKANAEFARSVLNMVVTTGELRDQAAIGFDCKDSQCENATPVYGVAKVPHVFVTVDFK
jgi:hypothetical protein